MDCLRNFLPAFQKCIRFNRQLILIPVINIAVYSVKKIYSVQLADDIMIIQGGRDCHRYVSIPLLYKLINRINLKSVSECPVFLLVIVNQVSYFFPYPFVMAQKSRQSLSCAKTYDFFVPQSVWQQLAGTCLHF